MPYISYLFSLLTAVFLVGAVSGLAAYTIARNRRILAQAQTPTPVGADVWSTPVRTMAVFAAVLFAAIVMPVLSPPSSIGFTDVALTVLLLAGICWATPAGIIAPTEVSSALLGASPVLIAVATAVAIYAVKGEAYHDLGWSSRAPLVGLGLGLAVAGVVRARFGIPEAVWYSTHQPPAATPAQAGQAQPAPVGIVPPKPVGPPRSNVRHMVLPPMSELGRRLKDRVHGQTKAVVRLIRSVGSHESFFSKVSTKPLVLVLAGPVSCGKEHFAREFAAAVGGRFQSANPRSDAQGDALYEGLKSYRVNGDAAVIYMEGFQSSKKATDLISRIVLDGHPDGDDWSRSVIVLPIVVEDALPTENNDDLIAALDPMVARTLLRVAIVVPMQALDENALITIGHQVACDEAAKQGVEIADISTDALVALIADRDRVIPGAKAVQAAVQYAMVRRVETAKLKSWKRIALAHDGTSIVVTEAKTVKS